MGRAKRNPSAIGLGERWVSPLALPILRCFWRRRPCVNRPLSSAPACAAPPPSSPAPTAAVRSSALKQPRRLDQVADLAVPVAARAARALVAAVAAPRAQSPPALLALAGHPPIASRWRQPHVPPPFVL